MIISDKKMAKAVYALIWKDGRSNILQELLLTMSRDYASISKDLDSDFGDDWSKISATAKSLATAVGKQ